MEPIEPINLVPRGIWNINPSGSSILSSPSYPLGDFEESAVFDPRKEAEESYDKISREFTESVEKTADPYPFLTKKNDAATRMILEAQCSYAKPLQSQQKDFTHLTPEELAAYSQAREDKVVFDRLFFNLLEENINDVVQFCMLRDEVETTLTGDESRAEHFNFEAFLRFCAERDSSIPNKEAQVAQWMDAWKALKHSKINASLKQKIQEFRSFRTAANEKAEFAKAQKWLKASRLYTVAKILRKLGITPAEAAQFVTISNLLFKITDSVQSITNKVWSDAVTNDFQPYPVFKQACLLAQVRGPLKTVLTEYYNYVTSHFATNPVLPITETVALDSQDKELKIVRVIGTMNPEALNNFLNVITALKNSLQQLTEKLPNHTRPKDKIQAKAILDAQHVVGYKDQLLDINPATIVLLLNGADIAVVNQILAFTSKVQLKEYYRNKDPALVGDARTFGVFVEDCINLHYKLFVKLLNRHQERVYPEPLRKTESLLLLSDFSDEGERKISERCKTELSTQLTASFKEFSKDHLKNAKSEFEAFAQDSIQKVRVELKKNTLKQYKLHSFTRFVNFALIHHRFKINADSVLSLIPKDFPEKDTLVNEVKAFFNNVLEKSLPNGNGDGSNANHLFDYRKLQAACTGKDLDDSCEEKLTGLHNVFYMYHMHLFDGVDITSKHQLFGNMQEAHHYPFPDLFGFYYDDVGIGNSPESKQIVLSGIQEFLGGQGLCFHKEVFRKDGSFDLEKFNLSFKSFLSDMAKEIDALNKGDANYGQEVLKRITKAFALMNMAAIYESSQTTHILAFSNQALDKLSEVVLSKGQYKHKLAKSLQDLLKSNPDASLGDFYNWYFKETLDVVKYFKNSILGWDQTLELSLATNVKDLFKKVIWLKDRFELEQYIHESFQTILDKTKDIDATQSLLKSLYALSKMSREVSLTRTQLQSFLNIVLEAYARANHLSIDSCFKDKKAYKKALLNILLRQASLEEIEQHVGSKLALGTEDVDAMIAPEIASLKDFAAQKAERPLLKLNACYLQSEKVLQQFGERMHGLLQVCFSQRIEQAIVYGHPLTSKRLVHQA